MLPGSVETSWLVSVEAACREWLELFYGLDALLMQSRTTPNADEGYVSVLEHMWPMQLG